MAAGGEHQGRPFLTAEWRDLAMVNFEVDPGLLEQFVPAGTRITRWRGKCLASVVAFRFLGTKVLGVPVPLHRDFEELNLRFYVERRAGGELRRGVVFIKEVVPRRAVTLIARSVYNENYHTLPMRHAVGPGTARYEWQSRGRWSSLAVAATAAAAVPDPDSKQSFIAEHHWGYVSQRDGATVEYRVERPRWRVAPAELTSWEIDGRSLYGEALGACLEEAPDSVYLAEGSAVAVGRGRRLDSRRGDR